MTCYLFARIRYRFLLACGLACLCLLSGCDSSPATRSVGASTPSATGKDSNDDPESANPYHVSIPPTSIDATFLQIEEQIPGFAGLHDGGDGLLQAFVQEDELDAIDPAELRAAIETAMGDLSSVARVRGESTVDVTLELIPVEFSFSQLSDIRVAVMNVLSVDGVHGVDVDEVTNRVRILGDGEFALLAARDYVDSMGLSFTKIVFTDAPMPELMGTVRGKIRGLAGGVQIAYDESLCTLGFNATLQGYSGFVTNAHCTTEMFTVTGTHVYQSINTSNNPIRTDHVGMEMVDPPLKTSGNLSYRFSDAAFIRTRSFITLYMGKIVRTKYAAYRTGDGSINSSNYMEIDTNECAVMTGQEVDKIGRTTGWTFGDVESTCQSVNMGSYTLYCQDEVYANVGRGDSGSPTFLWKQDTDGNGLVNVDLAGSLWSRRTYLDGKKTFLYSPICQIKADLGSLQTY
jgi:hypothetical protein